MTCLLTRPRACVQANSEVSALLGRIPSAVGYQPTLATDLGGLQERITTTSKGSITSVQAVYVPADDLTDPAPATTFAHLDATTVLSRSIAELGIYPAVDPLDSTSRMLDKRILGEAHYNVARGVQKVLQDYKNLQVRALALFPSVCLSVGALYSLRRLTYGTVAGRRCSRTARICRCLVPIWCSAVHALVSVRSSGCSEAACVVHFDSKKEARATLHHAGRMRRR